MTQTTESPVDSAEWPPGVYESLDRWRQGDVIEGIPLVALGVSGVPPLWARCSLTATSVAGLPLLAGEPAVPGRAMVVSQGCDLVKPTFPFATIVPVYDAVAILDEQQKANARTGGTWHLVHLTADWAASGFWVADLRLETAVDKTILAEAEPLKAFADEAAHAKLAERLAALRQRPAVPQPCLDHVIRPLKVHLAERVSGGAQPLAGVREVRVQSNHPTSPTAVRLFVVANEGEQPDCEEWNVAFEAVHAIASAAGIALSGPEVGSLYDMSAADYLNSQAVADADSS